MTELKARLNTQHSTAFDQHPTRQKKSIDTLAHYKTCIKVDDGFLRNRSGTSTKASPPEITRGRQCRD